MLLPQVLLQAELYLQLIYKKGEEQYIYDNQKNCALPNGMKNLNLEILGGLGS